LSTNGTIEDRIDELIAEGRLDEAYTYWKTNMGKYFENVDDMDSFMKWVEKMQVMKDRNPNITIPKLNRAGIVDEVTINEMAEKGRQYYLEKRKLELEVKQLSPSFWKTFERISLWAFALGGLIIAIIALIFSLK